MPGKEQLINEFASLIPFVQSLRALDDEQWNAPLGEGKWTTRDVIAHIMLWDKYFLEGAIEKITNSQRVTVQHLDFNEFNQKAVEYAKDKSKQEIIDLTIHYRSEILRHLSLLLEEEFVKEHTDGDGNPFSAMHYLLGFIPHDAQHVKQLKALFEKV